MKEILKNKKIVIGAVSTLLILGGIGGYYMYDNHRKETIKNEMLIIFTDVKEIEYGTKDYDVKKELVKNVENAEIKDFSKLDTSTIGEQTLSFTLVKDDVEKLIEHKVKIIDTKVPIIELETESKEIYVNDEYDFMSNIKEVKDEVDGAISLKNDALEINKSATEEYNKLSKENISDDTKVANTPLKDFLIEDVDGKEEKVLYLKGYYYVDGAVDTSTVGEYKITIIAIDINGLKTDNTFNVIVKEKEVIKSTQPTTSNGSNSNTGANNGGISSGNNGNSSGSNTPEWGWGLEEWNDEEAIHIRMRKNMGLMTKEEAEKKAKSMGLKEGQYEIIKTFVCDCGYQFWGIGYNEN